MLNRLFAWTASLLRIVAFRLVPVLIIAGIIWSGYRVAGDLVRQLDERAAYADAQPRIAAEASAVASGGDAFSVEETLVPEPTEDIDPTQPTTVPTGTTIPTDEPTDVPPTETPAPFETETLAAGGMAVESSATIEPSATVEPSATPEPTATETPSPTDMPEPSATQTDTPTATPEPTETSTDVPTATPESTATQIPVPTDTAEPTMTPIPSDTPQPSVTPTDLLTNTPTLEPTSTADTSVLVFATNTPRPVIFATNTPAPVMFATNTPAGGGVDQAEPTAVVEPTATTEPPTAVPTPLPAPTDAPAPTLTPLPPTATEAPTQVAQPTATNTLPPFFFPNTPEPGKTINGMPVPTEVPLIPREYNLFNVILLGGDDELTDDGSVRTDTMIVVSVNKDTNTVSMISFPRDLYVYVPTADGAMMRLNTVYGFARSFGWQPSAFDLLRRTFAYNFGINIHHYALVNFGGFQEIIDTLGGVPIAVDCAYQDYRLIGAELPDGAVVSEEDEDLYTVDVGYYDMSGAQALWYARTRRSATDFDRGRRQQQILWAMWRQALDTGQISNLPQLWGQATDVLETSVDVTDVFGLVPIALNLGVSDVRSYTMRLGFDTQPLTVDLNGVSANVQVPVYENLRPLLEDFYRPPTQSQVLIEGATVAVYNGTSNETWDRVAAERLGWEGFRASWRGPAAEMTDQTILIDQTGQTKGSSLAEIASLLNVAPENIRIEPDPNREADFLVILGSNYNSCTYEGVLEVE